MRESNDDFFVITECRICGANNLREFLEFGLMPLAGGFPRPEDAGREKRYPLTVAYCGNCHEVQLLETVSPALLFRDYRYTASTTSTLSRHFAEYAREMKDRFLESGDLVVEFGSNDGVLLRPFLDLGVNAVGVDPASNIVALAEKRGCVVINDFFTVAAAERILAKYGPASLVCANNVFAHIADLHEPLRAVERLLRPDGVFVFEVHYLGSLLESFQYDMIYHEHLFHHSLTALGRLLELHGIEPFEARKVSTHLGSLRVCARFRGGRPGAADESVARLLAEEHERGLDREETFRDFGRVVLRKRDELAGLVGDLTGRGKIIAGYGASGRASVHINYCRFGPDVIPFVLDESPERQGRLIPGMHNPIVPPEDFRRRRPDFALLFAYNYFDEAVRKETAFLRRGGRFILPLPSARVVDA
jgi:SAM-dependent methyltransferase